MGESEPVLTMRRALSIVAALTLLITLAWWLHRPARLIIADQVHTLPADGRMHRVARVRLQRGTLTLATLSSPDARTHFAPDGDAIAVIVQTEVFPAQQTVTMVHGRERRTFKVTLASTEADSFGDGTPDALRLHSSADRTAFRAWFAGLADIAAGLEHPPAEINDCAALLRWSYRNALHAHDDAWRSTLPAFQQIDYPAITQYSFPHTPLQANLFRVTAGPYRPTDTAAFAQFADARTLWQHNTFFVSRELRAARTGDLLFYRQLEQNSPHHSMVLTGANADWAVYHTGPIGKGPGEIRRVAIADLLHHPDIRWRPQPENANFLGVYRWTILRQDH